VRPVALNHVSIPALDVDEAMRWWQALFGMEQLPAPNFGFPVRWLRLGDFQLHLYTSEQPSQQGQHFGMEVDDFEEAYRRLDAAGAFEERSRFASMYELPNGIVQLYFRDPYGNLVEIDHPDVSALDRSLFGDRLRRLEDDQPQDEENRRATLFMTSDQRSSRA
jgi:catechol 2,3-dioxygenase-like lactoylglutathione lyase family enzyme